MTDQVDRAVFPCSDSPDGPRDGFGSVPAAPGGALPGRPADRPGDPAAARSAPVFQLPGAPAAVCDRDGVVVQASPELAALAGLADPRALVGARLHRFVLGSDDDAALAWPGGGPVTRVRVVRVPLAPLPDGSELVMVLLVDVSDLQRAVHQLAEERRRIAEVERIAGIGSWEFDPRSGETVWSRNHYALLGIEPGSIVPGAQAVLDVTHPDDVDPLAEYWGEHRQSGAGIDIEYRVRRTDGEWRRLHGLAKAQHDSAGRVTRYTGSIRDITDQREAEEQLAQERARLLEAQRISRVGSWEIELPSGRSYFSVALVEMFGELGVDPHTDPLPAIHPDDRDRIAQLISDIAGGPTGMTVEVEVRGAPPAETVYVCRARGERDAAGDLTRVLGTVQDVTEPRAMERQLREERRRLAEAQRIARIGTWEWDLGTDRVVWSDMLHELYRVPRTQPVTYQSYLAMVHPEDRDWLDEQCRDIVRTRQPMHGEHRVVLADGSQRVFRVHGAAVETSNGTLSIVGTAQDVTEQRAAEARVRRINKRFADLVSITPIGIGLFDAAERLVDANDALCELLGHPLDALRGVPVDALTLRDDEPGRGVRADGGAGAVGGAQGASRLLEASHAGTRVPQLVLRRADGEAVHCELHVSVSVQDDGQQFWLVVFSDVTERLRAAELLRHQATHDDLTGLPNRFRVKEVLAELLGGPTRDRVAVLFCDIDNFKRVNDSLGHDAGDELLVALARRLEAGMPDGCMAARLGGDEYLVICSDTDLVGGVGELVDTAASLLRTAVALRGQPVRVSATIGAATPTSKDTAPEDLLRFADAAMYQAKRTGRGRAAVASAALIADADRQVVLEGELREALQTDQLVLAFQPVVDPDGRVLSAEALLRWPHPERGVLFPGAFLPIAEQGDLMRELDRWVLRAALREAVSWPRSGGRPVGVAVNLSGLVPGDRDFVDTVANVVEETGIEYERVVLELVETALVDLPSRPRSAMAALVDRGVRFAVDDFGTGYSSLARLKELPTQIVKVDRQFVSGVGTDPSDYAVARAVVDIARAMDRSVVAEGVETVKQFHVLRGMGVEAYQGWLFSKPVPPREFREIVRLGPLHVPHRG